MIGDLFCTIRCLNSGKHLRDVRRAICTIIEERLEIDTINPPDPDDVRRTRKLLDSCYVHHQMSYRPDHEQERAQREEEANDIAEFFTGNSTSL